MMKHKAKNVIAGLLAASMLLAASGCQQSRVSSESSQSSDSQSVSQEAEEPERPEYLFVNPLDPVGIIVPGEKPVQDETYDLTEKVK